MQTSTPQAMIPRKKVCNEEEKEDNKKPNGNYEWATNSKWELLQSGFALNARRCPLRPIFVFGRQLGGHWTSDRLLNKGIHIKVSFRRWLVRKLLSHGRDKHSQCPLETTVLEFWVHNSYARSDNIRLAVLKLGESICYMPRYIFFFV